MSKTIILCADDYGYNPAVSAGIRELIVKNRLSATSCMVNLPNMDKEAKALCDLPFQVLTGLHINLTEGYFLTKPVKPCPTVSKLLFAAHFKLLDLNFIVRELHAQIDVFIKAYGRQPDFIDGHQHVHQFPQIREAVIRVFKQRMNKQAFIRTTDPGVKRAPFKGKSALLSFSGGWCFSRMLKEHHIAHNSQFAGVYDFKETRDYRLLFVHWLKQVGDQALIMCHPGMQDAEDPIALSRMKEFTYFSSEEFLKDCENFDVRI